MISIFTDRKIGLATGKVLWYIIYIKGIFKDVMTCKRVVFPMGKVQRGAAAG